MSVAFSFIPVRTFQIVTTEGPVINIYNKRIRLNNQDWQQKTCWPVSQVTEDVEHFFSGLTLTHKRIIEYLLVLHEKYRDVSPSQDTIAKAVGATRETVCRSINWMEKMGLLVKNYRNMSSCQYKLSPFFFNASIQSRLRHIIPYFKRIVLSLLFSVVPVLRFSSDVTQLNKKLNKNIFINNKHRSAGEVMKPFEQKYHGEKPVSPTLQGISCLNLTKAGQIRLTPFPDEALVDAQNAMKYAKNIKDPFNWFFKMCLDYCKRNDIAPDWPFMHTLMERHKIQPDALLIKDSLAIQSSVKVVKKTAPKETISDKKPPVSPPMYTVWDNPDDKIDLDTQIKTLELNIIGHKKALEGPVVYAPLMSYAQRLLVTAQMQLAVLKEKRDRVR